MPLSPRQWQLVGVGAAAGVGFLLWKYGTAAGEIAVGAVTNVFSRGNRLNHTTTVAGVVPDDPQELIDEASAVLGRPIDADTYALARMGRSEGIDGMEYRMHVALNDLADLQGRYGTNIYSSVLALMVHSKNAIADGHFSDQGLGKRYATPRDPYAGDVLLAERVQADHAAGTDPTGGATKFVDKDSFGVQAGTSSYEDQVSAWADEGLVPMNLPGASDNFVVFYRSNAA
jgi:hypothetical protein